MNSCTFFCCTVYNDNDSTWITSTSMAWECKADLRRANEKRFENEQTGENRQRQKKRTREDSLSQERVGKIQIKQEGDAGVTRRMTSRRCPEYTSRKSMAKRQRTCVPMTCGLTVSVCEDALRRILEFSKPQEIAKFASTGQLRFFCFSPEFAHCQATDFPS